VYSPAPSAQLKLSVSAVPIAEGRCHVGALHHVAELPTRVLVPGRQEREHIVAVVAAEELDECGEPVGGDDVDPFVGGDGFAEELADARALVVAGDSQGAVLFEGGVQVAGAEVVAVVAEHDAARRVAGPGVGEAPRVSWRLQVLDPASGSGWV
jgi:hypothetical protein